MPCFSPLLFLMFVLSLDRHLIAILRCQALLITADHCNGQDVVVSAPQLVTVLTESRALVLHRQSNMLGTPLLLAAIPLSSIPSCCSQRSTELLSPSATRSVDILDK